MARGETKMNETIVKKGTAQFKEVQNQYLKLFFATQEQDYIKKGEFEYGENKGKFLGMTSKKIQEANLPMPFGCPSLFIQPCFNNAPTREPDQLNKLTGIIWFCDRVGCICVCCREDFKAKNETFPLYCPNPWEMQGAEIENEQNWDDSEDPDEWEDDESDDY